MPRTAPGALRPATPPGRSARAAWATVLLAAVAVLVLGPARSASAHDYLVSSDPAANSTVREPVTRVTLTFDAAVLDYGRGSTALWVQNGHGRHFETSCAAIDGDTVRADTALGGSGVYTVTWRVVSADGHPVTNAIRFGYDRPKGAAVSAGSAIGPDCGVATSAARAATGTTGGAAWFPWLVGAGAVLVLGLAAAAFWVITATRTSPAADAAGDDRTRDDGED